MPRSRDKRRCSGQESRERVNRGRVWYKGEEGGGGKRDGKGKLEDKPWHESINNEEHKTKCQSGDMMVTLQTTNARPLLLSLCPSCLLGWCNPPLYRCYLPWYRYYQIK